VRGLLRLTGSCPILIPRITPLPLLGTSITERALLPMEPTCRGIPISKLPRSYFFCAQVSEAPFCVRLSGPPLFSSVRLSRTCSIPREACLPRVCSRFFRGGWWLLQRRWWNVSFFRGRGWRGAFGIRGRGRGGGGWCRRGPSLFFCRSGGLLRRSPLTMLPLKMPFHCWRRVHREPLTSIWRQQLAVSPSTGSACMCPILRMVL
jgi:hypothetical protein